MARSDEALRRRYGSILESKERLRHPICDEPTSRRCDVCGDILVTHGDAAKHEMQHAQEGRLVAYISSGHLSVSFIDPERWAGFRRLDHRKRIDPQHLDTRSNAIRPICDVCEGYVHLAGRVARHNHEPEGEPHEAVIRGMIQ